jgi:hypothetical protein
MRYLHPYADAADVAEAAIIASSGETKTGGDDYTQYVPLVKQLLGSGDPREEKRVLEAKLANARAMRRKFPLLAIYYDGEIRKLRAKIAAADEAISRVQKKEKAGMTLRYLAVAGGVVLVGVLATLAYRNLRAAKAAKGQ